MAGRNPGFLSTSESRFSLTHTGMASLSRTSLMTICSGSIRRPLGAALSIGITNRTISPGLNKSPHRNTLSSSCLIRPAMRSLSSYIFVPSMALTYMDSGFSLGSAYLSSFEANPYTLSEVSEADLSVFVVCSAFSALAAFFRQLSGLTSGSKSHLLYTIIYGILRSRMSSKSSSSQVPRPFEASATSTARSLCPSICLVRLTLSSPKLPSSSKPGVSIITTGPRGSSSIAFLTGSVVVPSTSDTTESSCPVTAFTRLDLPAFLRPKKPICMRSLLGVSFNPILCLPNLFR